MATQRNMLCSGKQESSRVDKVLDKNKGIRIDKADVEDGNVMLKMYTVYASISVKLTSGNANRKCYCSFEPMEI